MVCDDEPFTFIESPNIRALLRPEIGPLSANTLKRTTIECYKEEGERIADQVRNAGTKISVTLDCWTSPNTNAFLGVTAHYIDDDWTLRSLVLACIPLLGEHSGEDLCEAFTAKCDQLALLPNLLGVTTDNAANINRFLALFERVCQDKGIAFDKKEQHARCLAHVINLAVQALLRELGAEAPDGDCSLDSDAGARASEFPCITKLRRLVTKARSTPQRRNEFRRQCELSGTAEKEAIRDVRTRWNSTHAMIKRACELRGPLSNLAETDSELCAPSDEEWELLKVVAQLLSIFEEAAQSLCAANYPTLNEAVPTYNCLFDELEGFLGMRNEDDDGKANAAVIGGCSPANRDALRNAIQAAHAKLRTYYGKTYPRMYAIAVILDPRFKLDYYEEHDWEPTEISDARDALVRAVEEYRTVSPQPDQAGGAARLGRIEEQKFRGLKRRRVQKESEVERYLAAPTVDAGEDILKWWSRHSDIYPSLARLARDYLAIPATSAPVERVFSGGADLVTDKRGSLSKDTIEACVCLGSWL